MYLTKKRLSEAGINAEKIDKFAELFPNGTEVTRELCIKHPDVFSIGGIVGVRLALRGCKADEARKRKAASEFFMMFSFRPGRRRFRMNDLPTLNKVSPKADLPVIPKMTMEEYNLKLALLFYETSVM